MLYNREDCSVSKSGENYSNIKSFLVRAAKHSNEANGDNTPYSVNDYLGKLFNPIWSGLFDGRYGPGGGAHMPPPPLISKSTNSILMTIYSTLHKICSRYISVICFKIGLGLAEIIRCLCTKVVFLQIIGGCGIAWTISIKFFTCMSSENCCA